LKRDKEKQLKEKTVIVHEEKAPKFIFPDVGNPQQTAVIKFDDVSFGYKEFVIVVKKLQYGIYMDSRIALVGANGTGKSTIMKLMSGELQPTHGTVELGKKLRICKFDQHAEEKLDLECTPCEWLQRNGKIQSEGQCRKFLGMFGLGGNLAVQKIGELSGGQKSRLVFATLAEKKPHLMLLDEPTNHLDLFAIGALAEGLKAYKGGLVIISHNQKILEWCCDETWV